MSLFQVIFRKERQLNGIEIIFNDEGTVGLAVLPDFMCSFRNDPGKGEFFSRGLQSPLTGTTEWTAAETPFFLKKGEKPDLIRIGVVVEGTGRVGIRDVEVRTNAKALPAVPAQPPG